MTSLQYSIRDARADDLSAVRSIYAHYVANSTVTFDDEAMTLREWRRMFVCLQTSGMPFIVAESSDEQILGYALVSPWKQKRGYRFTVENSIYLDAAFTGAGVGTVLLQELIDRSKAAGFTDMIAVIADTGAEASLTMHRNSGFEEIGRMDRVGFKFDRRLGTVLLQKSLT